MGTTWASTSSLPFVELMSALPAYGRTAASITAGSAASIWSGSVVTPWISLTSWHITVFSSISGRPAFTSIIWAPSSVWAMAMLIT